MIGRRLISSIVLNGRQQPKALRVDELNNVTPEGGGSSSEERHTGHQSNDDTIIEGTLRNKIQEGDKEMLIRKQLFILRQQKMYHIILVTSSSHLRLILQQVSEALTL